MRRPPDGPINRSRHFKCIDESRIETSHIEGTGVARIPERVLDGRHVSIEQILAFEVLAVMGEGLAPVSGLIESEFGWGCDAFCWFFDSTLEKEMVEVNPESTLESEGRLSFPLGQDRVRQQK